jgi:hypothetical protein
MHRTMRIPSHRSGEASLHCRSSYKTIRRLNYCTRARYICMSHVDTPLRIQPFPLALSARATEFEAIDDSFRKTVGSKLGLQNTWIRARSFLYALYLEFALVDVAHQRLVDTMPCLGTDLFTLCHTLLCAYSYISEMTPAMPAMELLYLFK